MVILSILKSFTNPKLKHDHQYQILHRMEQLFEHGYTLNDALDILKWEKHIEVIIKELEQLLYQGDNFIQALEKLHFNQEIIHYLKIAYQNGNLNDGLKNCCLMLKQRRQLLERLKNISRYPLLLFSFFFVILYFMKTSIFPSFTQLFGNTSESTHALYYAEWVIQIIFHGTITFVMVILICMILSFTFRNKLPIETKISIIEHIPIYKKYIKMHTTYLFVTHLGSLLSSGLTMKDSLQVIKSQKYQDIMHYYAAKINNHLTQGHDYFTILPHCTLLEDNLTRIMTKDRNQEQLLRELTMYAEHLLQTMETSVKKWLELLQPIILSILAIFVIFIYATLMLPMFDYIQTL